jgi:hypothetical protein
VPGLTFWVLVKGLRPPSEAEKSAHTGVDILRREWLVPACILTYLHPRGLEKNH